MTVLILGMHRSGTSAITRLVADMGAYLGADLLPASPDNPRGFWERKDVLAINRAILTAQNCNWYTVAGFDSARPLPAGLHAPMERIVAELTAHAPFAVKDPRFCLTLPYWLPLFRTPPLILLALRHPAAVADSLTRRNQMPPEQGLALWESYMAQAQRHIAGKTVVRCQFEALLANPEAETTTLHAVLTAHVPGLTLPASHAIKAP